jgi:hypothetical protein
MGKIYLLHRPTYAWDEYGDVLLAGLTERLPREDGQLQLERTGPFVPPIGLSGDHIIVTDDMRRRLETSGLAGISFRPVILRHIVHLDWHTWDRQAEEPAEYPATGDPDDYILERPHDPTLAEQMGDLWEVVTEERAELERVRTGPNPWDARVYLKLDTWDGTDFFKARGYGFTYVSERAKVWLEDVAGEWVDCREALVK